MKNCSLPFDRRKRLVCLDRQKGDRTQGVVNRAGYVERKLETMRCERCAGLMIAEHFIGGGTSLGGWTYGGWRCVNCGAIGLSGQAGAHHAHHVMRNVAGGEKNGRQSRAPSTTFHRHE
jgi:hypothetical protein